MWSIIGILFLLILFIIIEYRALFLSYFGIMDIVIISVVILFLTPVGAFIIATGIKYNLPYVLVGFIMCGIALLDIIGLVEDKGIFSKK